MDETKQTVRLDIRIHIDNHDDDCDTGLSVEAWNALTDRQRSGIYRDIWETMAQQDDGGVSVKTPGAVSL